MKTSVLVISFLFSFIPASVFAQEQCVGCVAVYGDSRSGHDVHKQIVAAIEKSSPSIVFHTGDMIFMAGKSDWQTFGQITASLRSHTEFFPLFGNHDTGDSANYFQMFPQVNGARWYSVDRKGLHFIALDTNSKFDKNSAQYKWFEADLKKSSGTPTILLTHVPFYSSGSHANEGKIVRDTLGPLVEQYGITLVISGHDHGYEKSFKNGVYYIISGGGGAELRDKAYPNAYSQLFIKNYNFVSLSFKNGAISADVLDSSGNKLDSFAAKPRAKRH